jgi:6-phosphogluconate dehydrogenase
MIGGSKEAVIRLDPIFRALAPGRGNIPRTPGRDRRGGTAEEGYLHCGPAGAGHFASMVHAGIESSITAAYAEGLNILKHADAGLAGQTREAAEGTPFRYPEHYQYEFDLSDITELWRRSPVLRSWPLDLITLALAEDPALHREDYAVATCGVADSSQGRGALHVAIEEGVPSPILAAALSSRLSSRHEGDFAWKVLRAMHRRLLDEEQEVAATAPDSPEGRRQ